MAKKKIDPLNRKLYGAVSAALTVSNIPAAVSFYQEAFGFSKRAIMNGPDGKPIHAELTLRGTTLMLAPESEQMGRRSAKSVGASPATLYIYVENVDKVVEKAAKLGATPQGPRTSSVTEHGRRTRAIAAPISSAPPNIASKVLSVSNC